MRSRRPDGGYRADLARLKRTTSSGFYCGVCGTRERGKHKKALHMQRDPICANQYRFGAGTCRKQLKGSVPYGAKCEACDPGGASRRWKQPKDEPLD